MITYRLDARLKSRIDPSDVVQESLITAHAQMNDYLADRPIDFYPWLRQIALNRLVDATRRHLGARRRSVSREISLRTKLPDESAEQLYRIAAPDSGPSQRAQKHEMMQSIADAMNQLPDIAREVLELRFVEQLSTNETADVIGISVSAVQGRQVRALARLRVQLADESGQLWRSNDGGDEYQ
jgi:RNA polymerase sigma-70 factor (ECF subfamily)